MRSVVIPPSVEFIGSAAVNAYNYTLVKLNPDLENIAYVSEGTMTITFLPNSKIQYIDNYGFCRKKNIIINFYDKKQFSCHRDIFLSNCDPHYEIYAPYTSKFCHYKTNTVYQQTCKIIKTASHLTRFSLIISFICLFTQ